MGLARKIATVGALSLLGALVGGTTAWAGGGGHCEPTEGNATTVELSGACFTATTSYVEPGETVTFVNRDPYLHNVSGSGWGHYSDMGNGDTYSTSFPDRGVFAFACTLHPGMTGSIVVGEGEQMTAAQIAEPAATSFAPGSSNDGWIPAAAIGLLIGAVAGAVLARTVSMVIDLISERGKLRHSTDSPVAERAVSFPDRGDGSEALHAPSCLRA